MAQSVLPKIVMRHSVVENMFQPIMNGESFSDRTDAVHDVLKLERLISISLTKFVNLPSDRIDQEIKDMLRLILDSCLFDGCGLMKLTGDRSEARTTHVRQRQRTGVAPASFRFSDMFPWTGEMLLQGNIVCFSSLDELPSRAAVDRRRYEEWRVNSNLAIPIYFGGSVQFIIFAYHHHVSNIWCKESISLLRLVGEVFVNALGRCRDSHAVLQRLQFEQLISELSIKFINVVPEEVDGAIISSLEQIREMFQLDRVGLLRVSPDKMEAVVSYVCYGQGVSPVPEHSNIIELFPWSAEKVLGGEILNVASLDELPPEAAVDRKSYQEMGVKSCASIPILVSGSIDYVVSLHNNMQDIVDQNIDLTHRLRLLGEIFANALLRCKLELESRQSLAEIQKLKEKIQMEAEYLQSEITSTQRHEEIVGQSEALLKTLVQAEQVGPTNATVLICGETGTGKELVARAIHRLSQRRNKLMVKVNCASLPAGLIEGELFGREKGAYTGALTRQAGRFELADGGTIFLDEIAEMPLELQAKLLRVLQEGQFERLGSTKTIQVDVRVIAATNRNLAEEVKKGRFREDLYYRLNVFQIIVPPLRERIMDIPSLVWAFVNEFSEKMGKKIVRISKQDMAEFQRYHWPGNVRELRNIIEHAAIVSSGDRLQVVLPKSTREEKPGFLTLAEYEDMHIRDALRATGGRIKGEGGAADLLGLNPSTLYSRMQKMGIRNS